MFSDDEVIASVLAGRRQDFEILIQRYEKRIVNFIQRMIQDGEEARSLGQDTFLKVYENLVYYKSENNFQAFIFRIARNLTLNWIKKQRRIVFFSRLFHGGNEGDRFTAPGNPAASAEEAQRQNLVDRALRLLPVDQRLALVLKVYLDLSYHQIAAITSWSEPKIETLISRGRARLIKEIRLQEIAVPNVSHSEGTHELPTDD